MTDQHEGGCACGAVRYLMTSPPLYVHCCHCTWCQRESGASYAVNALIEADRVMLLRGEPQAVDTPTASGKGQVIFRCPQCQVALWSHYSGLGDHLDFVRVGTLDDPGALPPDIHIYTSTRQPWVQLPRGALAVPEYYDFRERWPEASIARRRALSDS